MTARHHDYLSPFPISSCGVRREAQLGTETNNLPTKHRYYESHVSCCPVCHWLFSSESLLTTTASLPIPLPDPRSMPSSIQPHPLEASRVNRGKHGYALLVSLPGQAQQPSRLKKYRLARQSRRGRRVRVKGMKWAGGTSWAGERSLESQ